MNINAQCCVAAAAIAIVLMDFGQTMEETNKRESRLVLSCLVVLCVVVRHRVQGIDYPDYIIDSGPVPASVVGLLLLLLPFLLL